MRQRFKSPRSDLCDRSFRARHKMSQGEIPARNSHRIATSDSDKTIRAPAASSANRSQKAIDNNLVRRCEPAYWHRAQS